MADEITKIRALLEAAQRKLKDLDKQALALRAEISAYEKVCTILSGQDIQNINGRGTLNGEGSGIRKSRGISDTWQKVIYWIHTQVNQPPETENIWGFTEREGLGVNRNTLRSQLSNYTKDGFLERIDGRYVVTDKGLSLIMNHSNDSLDAGVNEDLPPSSGLFDDVN